MYIQFYNKKNKGEKYLFESKEFKKLKSTDKKNQRERFSKNELLFYPYKYC